MRWIFIFAFALVCRGQEFNGLGDLAAKKAAAAAGGGTPTINNAWKTFNAAGPLALTVSPTAGHALVVAVAAAQSQTPGAAMAVSDNIDGTTGWTKCTGRTNAAVGYSMTVFIFIKLSVPSGVTTVTATDSDGSFFEIIAHDVSNISTFTSSEVNNAELDTGTNPQTGTVNNGTAASIYFAAAVSDGTGSWVINQTGTTGTWNHFSANSHEDDGNTKTATSVANIVVSTSTARGHGWTCDTGNEAQCIAVFH